MIINHFTRFLYSFNMVAPPQPACPVGRYFEQFMRLKQI